MEWLQWDWCELVMERDELKAKVAQFAGEQAGKGCMWGDEGGTRVVYDAEGRLRGEASTVAMTARA
jgi:hypothetical protein